VREVFTHNFNSIFGAVKCLLIFLGKYVIKCFLFLNPWMQSSVVKVTDYLRLAQTGEVQSDLEAMQPAVKWVQV
jgi:hypothetical protein